jgi:tRNA U34 5-methylaminomethyl-2-thiouridine-forming methyltransferase MnmC
VIESLNYGKLLDSEEWFRIIHQQGWNERVDYKNGISIEKILANWQETQVEAHYDVVFYDAFAPSKQPKMWGFELIKKACDALNPQGIFVTYSATGQLKRDLVKAGMTVETLPGPPGKKEMVRAVKN